MGSDGSKLRAGGPRDGPLNQAEIARPGGGEGSRIPRLPAHPGDRGQPVILLAVRIEMTHRAECSPAALDQYLETPFSKQPAVQQPEVPTPPVWRPYEN